MEQFSLGKYLENPSRRVVTRDGRPVRIVCWDAKMECPIMALALNKSNNKETALHYRVDGTYSALMESDVDLFFADEEEKTIDNTEMNSLAYLTELGYTCIPPKKEEELTENKNLEEAAQEYSFNIPTQLEANIVWKKETEQHFKDGALWQKQQIKETLQTEYEKGRFDMQQEMMKDAVGGVVHHFADDEVAAVHYNDPKCTPMSIYVSSKELSAGDRVKIIIIKEEQQ